MSADSAPEAPLRRRLHDVYDAQRDRTRQSLLVAWLAFAVTFGALRALTYAVHHGVGPFGDVSVGGTHVHHYVWGIGLLMAVGLGSLIVDSPRYNPWIGLAYGVGCALVIDEFALLIDLRDVYWSNEGRSSIDAALLVIAALGSYLSAATFWQGAANEIAHSLRRRRGGPGAHSRR